jgi:hypothetical protein
MAEIHLATVHHEIAVPPRVTEPETDDMVLDSGCSHTRHKALAVGLALMANEIGVRRTENAIHDIGTAFQDQEHGIDHDFDAFVGREKTERQNDGSAMSPNPEIRRGTSSKS